MQHIRKKIACVDKAGILSLWDIEGNLSGSVSQSPSLSSLKARAVLSVEPTFLPFIFSIASDGDVSLELKEKWSFITPLGSLSLSGNTSVYDLARTKNISVTDEDLFVVFKNEQKQNKDVYVIREGKILIAEVFGKSQLQISKNEIEINTDSVSSVRFRFKS